MTISVHLISTWARAIAPHSYLRYARERERENATLIGCHLVRVWGQGGTPSEDAIPPCIHRCVLCT